MYLGPMTFFKRWIFALIAGLSAYWISKQYNYNKKIFTTYGDFLDNPMDPRITFGLAAPTYVIFLFCIVGLLVIKGDDEIIQRILRQIYSIVCFFVWCQIVIYTCQNLYVLVDVFPNEDTCACDEAYLELIGTNNTEWLQCYCYLKDERDVYPFTIPGTDSEDYQTYNLRVRIDAFHNKNVSVTKEDYLHGANFTSNIDLINDTSIVKHLDPEKLWLDPDISLVYLFLFVVIMICFNCGIGLFSLLGSEEVSTLQIAEDMFDILILFVDNYSIVEDMFDNAAVFSDQKILLLAPLIFLSLCLLGLFGAIIYIFLNFNEFYESSNDVIKWNLEYKQTLCLQVDILLLFVSRTYIAIVVWQKTGLTFSLFAFYTIEILLFIKECMVFVKLRKERPQGQEYENTDETSEQGEGSQLNEAASLIQS